MLKFIVLFKRFQKSVTVEKVEDLENVIKSSFHTCPGGFPINYHIQRYCKEFQDFLDLDDLNGLEDLDKIQIIADEENAERHKDVNVGDSCSSSDDSDDEDEDMISENNDDVFRDVTNNSEPDFVPAVSSTLNERDLNGDNGEVHSDSSIISCNESYDRSESKFYPWPHPFLIDDAGMRKEFLLKVQKKEKLMTGDFTQIFRVIFDECTKYT